MGNQTPTDRLSRWRRRGWALPAWSAWVRGLRSREPSDCSFDFETVGCPVRSGNMLLYAWLADTLGCRLHPAEGLLGVAVVDLGPALLPLPLSRVSPSSTRSVASASNFASEPTRNTSPMTTGAPTPALPGRVRRVPGRATRRRRTLRGGTGRRHHPPCKACRVSRPESEPSPRGTTVIAALPHRPPAPHWKPPRVPSSGLRTVHTSRGPRFGRGRLSRLGTHRIGVRSHHT
jgi:hypothetical protein